MALAFYPHTLLFAPAVEAVDSASSSVSVPTFGTPVAVRGQLKAMTAEAAYKSHGIEVKQPHLFMFDLAYEPFIDPGYKATMDKRVFSVKTDPRRFDAGDTCDYADVLLEEEGYAE